MNLAGRSFLHDYRWERDPGFKVEAPRQEIDHIIDKHAVVRQLVDNEWILLIHIEPAAATVSRYGPAGGLAAHRSDAMNRHG